MLHKVSRHGRPVVVRSLLVVLALVAIGLVALNQSVSAQAPPDAWKARLDSAILARMAEGKTPGAQVAVVYRGEVIYAKAYGVADIETGRPVTNATLFRIGSVTKMMTGALAAELAEQGKLDLGAPIAQYVPSLAGKRVGAVTTHQLLTHTAGWRDNAVPYGRMGEGALGEVMREVTDTLFITEPGSVLSYSNPGYSMAGYVLERAGGDRYGNLMDRIILRPTGMPYATFRPLSALTRDFSHGHVGRPAGPGHIVRPFTENTAQWAAGFLMASASDVARFASMLMDGGSIGGTRVISENAARRVTSAAAMIPGDSTAHYGYGVMITQRDGRVLWQHGGSIDGFDAFVTMLPQERFAFVVLDNRTGAPLGSIARIAVEAVTGMALPAPPAQPEERVATAEERVKLVGHYMLNPAVNLEIAVSGDSLVFRQGGASLGVRMLGDDQLRVKVPGTMPAVTLGLVRDASGRVVFLHQGLRAIPRVEASR